MVGKLPGLERRGVSGEVLPAKGPARAPWPMLSLQVRSRLVCYDHCGNCSDWCHSNMSTSGDMRYNLYFRFHWGTLSHPQFHHTHRADSTISPPHVIFQYLHCLSNPHSVVHLSTVCMMVAPYCRRLA